MNLERSTREDETRREDAYLSRPHIVPLSRHWKNELRSLQTQIQSARLSELASEERAGQGNEGRKEGRS